MRWSSRKSMLEQTLFAQLQQTATPTNFLRSVTGLPGGFSLHTVQNKDYWYYRFAYPGGRETQSLEEGKIF